MRTPRNSRALPLTCTTQFEEEMCRRGYVRVAGVDEVGRGALCGPVVAAAVILDPGRIPAGLNDSKKLSPSRRNALFSEIQAKAVAVGLGQTEAEGIDREDVLQATLRAMEKAILNLQPPADCLLLDAVRLPRINLPQQSIIKGDAQSVSIAAASIVAKVTRDRIMEELDQRYPQYLLKKNKGYGTAEHFDSLRRFGPSPIHRKTFRPVYQMDFAFD